MKQDADDFIKLQGPDAFERLLSGSDNGMEFRMAQIAGKYDLRDDEARVAYCRGGQRRAVPLWKTPWSGRSTPPGRRRRPGLTPEAMQLEVQRAFKRKADQGQEGPGARGS